MSIIADRVWIALYCILHSLQLCVIMVIEILYIAHFGPVPGIKISTRICDVITIYSVIHCCSI